MNKKVFKTMTMLFLCSVMIFAGCKKDDDDNGGGGESTFNHLEYRGQTYAITQGELSYYGYETGEDYNIDLNLWYEGDGFEYGIYFEMFTNSDVLSSGTYSYSSSTTSGTFDDGEFYFYKEGDYEIEGGITSGTVKINKSGDTYEITINCKDQNGRSITGYYKGSLYDYWEPFKSTKIFK